MKPFIIYADKQQPDNAVRPHFCYADGEIEKDLDRGGQCDYFFLSNSAKRILDKEGHAKEGNYPCVFEGKPATLFVWKSCGRTEGLMCYDDDVDARANIKEELERHYRHDLSPEIPKMEKNQRKHYQFLHEMKQELVKRNSHEKVAVEIYGKIAYLTEREVRALQVIAARKANESEEAFVEFCANVVVYSGTSKRKSYVMHWKKDGHFVESFESGFYDVCGQLCLVLHNKYENEEQIPINWDKILSK